MRFNSHSVQLFSVCVDPKCDASEPVSSVPEIKKKKKKKKKKTRFQTRRNESMFYLQRSVL